MSKNILITAGASGIGKAIAEAFEKNGDSIWIVDSDGEAIDKCSNNWNKSILDVRDEKSILKLFEEIKLKWKGVDVLCANAGIKGPTSLIENISIEEWKDYYRLGQNKDDADQANGGTPSRVIKSPDNRKFGLSPIPDQVYRIWFYAYDLPTELSAHGDTTVFPNIYNSVLMARARYY